MRVLLVAPAWIGDMVMAHALVQRLAERADTTEIHVLAPPATAAVAERMVEVTAVHVLRVAHGEFGWARRQELARELRLLALAEAFVLPNSWKSALVPWLANIPRRIGWLGEARYGLLTDTRRLPADDLPLMAQRFLALLDLGGPAPEPPLPLPRLASTAPDRDALLSALQLLPGGLAICPAAAFGPAKQWPAAHFAAIARTAAAAGRDVWILGGPADRVLCAAVHAASVESGPGQVHNLAGRTGLSDAIDLLAAAAAVVCNDSGLMHVACAVGTPVIALYGATSPAFTPPQSAQAQILRLGDADDPVAALPCQPCFERRCRFGHGHCLSWLAPDRVHKALQRLEVLP